MNVRPGSRTALGDRDGLLAQLSSVLALVPLAAIAALAYQSTLRLTGSDFGFPLDDAWIHQVYARNLGTRGEFSFFAGQPSAGSTSPLWACLLAVSYALRLDYRVWTVGLGVLCLAFSGFVAGQLARRLGAGRWVAETAAPLFVLWEWHLTWAAVSGMEITLFILLSLLLVERFLASVRPFWLGIIAGLLVLTRPEGVVLGAMVGAGLLWRSTREIRDLRRLAVNAIAFAAPTALLITPYVAFNLALSGSLFPNTFYAKSQEYGELLSRANFLVRWVSLYRQPFLGAQILLIPGLAWVVWRAAREGKGAAAISLLWVLALPALYALRLPVDYQFGRYEMPIIPFVVVCGLVGTEQLLARVRVRVIRNAWPIAIGVLVLAFGWLGANRYGQSVAIINCEMVATARWTRASLAPASLVAVHDIGAQGYFDNHPMLDLAGLVSPEVIPFIRDQARLLEWMQARGADYAVFFPSWYPQLAGNPALSPIHSESCAATREAGETDLVVYRVAR